MHPEPKSECQNCGKCCFAEIPVTLLDIHRYAHKEQISYDAAFNHIVCPDVIGSSGLFCIRKTATGGCIFLNDNRCDIHEFKPLACTLFRCWPPATSQLIAPDEIRQRKNLLWDVSVSGEVTRGYVRQCGSRWNETLFYRGIEAIRTQIATMPTQQLACALNGKGQLVGEVHDCETCRYRGKVAVETPVTLPDIQRIADGLHTDVANVFTHYVDSQPSALTGGLKLKRKNHCVFFHPQTHCRISSFRPGHCRMTPCARLIAQPDLYQCLFLGASSLEAQYLHQLSLEITRRYVSSQGTHYCCTAFIDALAEFDTLKANPGNFKKFNARILPFRLPQL